MIDLSRLPLPNAIEALDFETMFNEFMSRFHQSWDAMRAIDSSLPAYAVGALEADPIAILGQADTYLRLLDRQRVNDALRALLAPTSTGGDLDNLVARQGIDRLTVIPAVGGNAPVMETDAALLRRYLLSFDRPSAGSADRYLYEAWTAVPSLVDVRANGRAVHGRIGDTDVVIAGAGGADPTPEQVTAVTASVLHPAVKPEAVGVAVIPATRAEYRIEQRIIVPVGPDAALVRNEVETRLRGVALSRMQIGSGVPRDLIAGAAFGLSVIDVMHISPQVDIAAHPYTIPVCTEFDISVEVAA